jgi:Amt family ammonium transporter
VVSLDEGSIDPTLYMINDRPLTHGFMLLSTILSLLMQVGFAKMETGLAMVTNSQFTFMKRMLANSVVALCFYLVGFGLAYGEGPLANAFVGTAGFALSGVAGRLGYVFFVQYSYVMNASTLFGGSIAGRAKFMSFIAIAAAMATWVFPIAVHWVWSRRGWIFQLGGIGSVDFVGAGPVHVVGGTVGLLGALVIGRRVAFDPKAGNASKFREAHNKLLAGAGALFLWAGWMAYTIVAAGSVAQEHQVEVGGRVATVTLLAGAAAACTSFVVRRLFYRSYDIIWLANSMLCGLAAVTAPCAVIEPWAAIIVGGVAALLLMSASRLYIRLGIDDPLDASAVHMVGGIWGLLSVGLFAEPGMLAILKPQTRLHRGVSGLFYGGSGLLLGIQAVEAVAMLGWAIVSMGPLLLLLKRCGRLRVSRETEIGGLDLFKHGGSAFGDGYYGSYEDWALEGKRERARMLHGKRRGGHKGDPYADAAGAAQDDAAWEAAAGGGNSSGGGSPRKPRRTMTDGRQGGGGADFGRVYDGRRGMFSRSELDMEDMGSDYDDAEERDGRGGGGKARLHTENPFAADADADEYGPSSALSTDAAARSKDVDAHGTTLFSLPVLPGGGIASAPKAATRAHRLRKALLRLLKPASARKQKAGQAAAAAAAMAQATALATPSRAETAAGAGLPASSPSQRAEDDTNGAHASVSRMEGGGAKLQPHLLSSPPGPDRISQGDDAASLEGGVRSSYSVVSAISAGDVHPGDLDAAHGFPLDYEFQYGDPEGAMGPGLYYDNSDPNMDAHMATNVPMPAQMGMGMRGYCMQQYHDPRMQQLAPHSMPMHMSIQPPAPFQLTRKVSGGARGADSASAPSVAVASPAETATAALEEEWRRHARGDFSSLPGAPAADEEGMRWQSSAGRAAAYGSPREPTASGGFPDSKRLSHGSDATPAPLPAPNGSPAFNAGINGPAFPVHQAPYGNHTTISVGRASSRQNNQQQQRQGRTHVLEFFRDGDSFDATSSSSGFTTET